MFKIWSYFSFTSGRVRQTLPTNASYIDAETDGKLASESRFYKKARESHGPREIRKSRDPGLQFSVICDVMDYDSLIYSHIANYYDDLVSFETLFFSNTIQGVINDKSAY